MLWHKARMLDAVAHAGARYRQRNGLERKSVRSSVNLKCDRAPVTYEKWGALRSAKGASVSFLSRRSLIRSDDQWRELSLTPESSLSGSTSTNVVEVSNVVASEER